MIVRGTHYRVSFLLVLAFGLFLQACLAPTPAQPESELTTVKVSAAPFLSYAPFFIAADEGYFQEQGLEVEFVRFAHSPEAVPALTQGDIDVAGGFMSVSMFNAMARGSNLRIVADRSYADPEGCTYAGLIARQALMDAGELRGTPRLEGLRFGINEASIEGYYVEKLLQEAGLTLNDVEAEEIPESTMADALAKDSLDVVATSEPWVTRLSDAEQATVWLPVQEVIPDSQFAFLLYGPTLLEEDPGIGERFMVAYLKTARQLNEGKTERNLEILAEHTELEKDLLEQACWPAFRDGGKINGQSVLDFQDWAVDKGYLDQLITEEQFWDPSFVEHAKQILDASSETRFFSPFKSNY